MDTPERALFERPRLARASNLTASSGGTELVLCLFLERDEMRLKSGFFYS